MALPYFLAMASDLRYCGYKRLDVFRIYGFNLVLLPVNLAGTLSSVMQGITASKAPFARTPKVRNRTVVPPFFVVAPYLVIALAGDTFYFAYRHGRIDNMAYAASTSCWPVTPSRPSSGCAIPWWTRGFMPLRCCTSRPVNVGACLENGISRQFRSQPTGGLCSKWATQNPRPG